MSSMNTASSLSRASSVSNNNNTSNNTIKLLPSGYSINKTFFVSIFITESTRKKNSREVDSEGKIKVEPWELKDYELK